MALYGDKKREYQRNWMHARRIKLINILGGKCVRCGITENLEFHHKEPNEKEIDIKSILSRKMSIILVELEKCELLCEECHKQEKIDIIAHGTYDGYNHHGCRCEKCKLAKKIYREAIS